jgi:hypothetical protein
MEEPSLMAEPTMDEPSISTMMEDQVLQPSPEDLEDSKNEETQKDPMKGKKKLDEQMRFIESTTLDDVLVDGEKSIKVGRQNNDTNYLQLIFKGCSSKRLTMMQCLFIWSCIQKILAWVARIQIPLQTRP